MKIREIRRYSVRLFNAVQKLVPQLDPHSRLPDEEHLRRILRSGSSHLIIAESDNNLIIGMLTISVYYIPSGLKVWIDDVVVDESQRGQGIGRALLEYAISFARLTGAKSIDLTSRPFREGANRLYREMGFILRETNVYRYNL